MLTAEQIERRRCTLGASEIASVAGLRSRYTALDVWATKRRGPKLDIPPIIVEDEPDADTCDAFDMVVDTDVRTAGSILEAGIVALYEHRTGTRTIPSPTRRHAEHEWQTATPDRLVRPSNVLLDNRGDALVASSVDRGLECKLVGHWMRRDWPSDGIPDYVATQCQWCMYITGLDLWDVAALVDGTDFRIVRVERDDELIEGLVELANAFWHDNVLADVMPTAGTGDDVRRVLTARWRTDNGKTVELSGEQLEQATAVAEELYSSQKVERQSRARTKELKAILSVMCGENKGLAGPFGRYDFSSRQGTPKWKDIAEELAEGAIPNEVIERHRGQGFRHSKFYPHTKWRARQDRKE